MPENQWMDVGELRRDLEVTWRGARALVAVRPASNKRERRALNTLKRVYSLLAEDTPFDGTWDDRARDYDLGDDLGAWIEQRLGEVEQAEAALEGWRGNVPQIKTTTHLQKALRDERAGLRRALSRITDPPNAGARHRPTPTG